MDLLTLYTIFLYISITYCPFQYSAAIYYNHLIIFFPVAYLTISLYMQIIIILRNGKNFDSISAVIIPTAAF